MKKREGAKSTALEQTNFHVVKMERPRVEECMCVVCVCMVESEQEQQ